ncbi:MAG: aminopeptidase P family protein [Chloroflexi bacterium]|nr:aminopeptidase P family protein [Chloroflexota bacterium]
MPWQVPGAPAEEGEERHRRIRSQMADRGIDCLLIAGLTANYGDRSGVFRWVSNYAPWFDDEYVLFPHQGEPVLCAWSIGHASWAKRVSWIPTVWVGKINYVEYLVDRILKLGSGAGVIGLEFQGTPSYVFRGLAERLPEAKFVDTFELFSKLRMIKSPFEIECMERSAFIADEGIRALLEVARPGVTDREAWAAMDYRMTLAGAQPPTFCVMTSFSRYSEKGQAIPYGPSDRVMRPNDGIVNEVAPSYVGYITQICRPIALGRAEAEFESTFEVHVRMYEAAMKRIRPGVAVQDVDAEVKEIASSAGLSRSAWAMQHVGLLNTDRIPPDTKLQPGMTFVIHPYTDHGNGAEYGGHIVGDTVVITEDGCRRLSSLPYDSIMRP